MRVLETRMVSRKTPGDGRLEIARDTALALGGEGAVCRVTVGASDGTAAVTRMDCRCRAAGTAHEHWFLEGHLLRVLAPERPVVLTEHGPGTVVVAPG